MGRLKPDLLISDEHGRECAVVDAKYERLRSLQERPHGVDRGDLYQLVAYLAGHEVGYGALIYPPADADEAQAADLSPWRLGSAQEVGFLRFPASEATCYCGIQFANGLEVIREAGCAGILWTPAEGESARWHLWAESDSH